MCIPFDIFIIFGQWLTLHLYCTSKLLSTHWNISQNGYTVLTLYLHEWVCTEYSIVLRWSVCNNVKTCAPTRDKYALRKKLKSCSIIVGIQIQKWPSLLHVTILKFLVCFYFNIPPTSINQLSIHYICRWISLQAFKSLGSDAIVELKENPDTLREILLNHVSAGKVIQTTYLVMVYFYKHY